jgi:hypothetical protein
MSKQTKPMQSVRNPQPERVLTLDDAGRAWAARHVVEGKHGRLLMHYEPALADLAERPWPRAPYIESKV